MAKKEPWQMTRDEYASSLKGLRLKKVANYSRLGTIWHEHKNSVILAIQLGKPVPRKVILEFRRESPVEAHQFLDIPQGKYAPKVARYKLPGR